jgi:hypothetical protein
MRTVAGRRRTWTEIDKALPHGEAPTSHPRRDADCGTTESSSTRQQACSRRVRVRRKISALHSLWRLFPSASVLLDAIDSREHDAELLLCSVVFVLTCCILVRTYVLYPADSFQARSFKSAAAVRRYSLLYNQTYNMAVNRLQPPDRTPWPTYTKRSFELGSLYGSSLGGICGLSIVVMEAKLGAPVNDFGPGQPLWFALESLAAYSPKDACVVLMTSTCAMKVHLEEGQVGKDEFEESKIQKTIRQGIYDQSLPLFRRLIESGRVRLAFLDHSKVGKHTMDTFTSACVPVGIPWFRVEPPKFFH